MKTPVNNGQIRTGGTSEAASVRAIQGARAARAIASVPQRRRSSTTHSATSSKNASRWRRRAILHVFPRYCPGPCRMRLAKAGSKSPSIRAFATWSFNPSSFKTPHQEAALGLVVQHATNSVR